ncbi:MAG: TM0106 family RecB-like putative nuclease [Oligoflexales bacterium]
MKRNGKEWVFSPSDLTTFWESAFASWCDRHTKEFPSADIQPDEEDRLNTVLKDKGIAHEKNILEELKRQYNTVVTIDGNKDDRIPLEATLAVMKKGVDVIYQACLTKDGFTGFADFLVKVPGKSNFGDYYYEAWDTKLAGTLKSYFVIQLCAYSDMLQAAQGVLPESFKIVLGRGEETHQRLKVLDYFAYYQNIKKRFLEFHGNFDHENKPNPEKYRSFGKWSIYAETTLKDSDSLFQVAGINRTQVANLKNAKITTMAELAETELKSIHKMSHHVFDRLKHQCRIQIESRGQEVPRFEVLDHGKIRPSHGLHVLPPASELDVYFDMEGFPLVENGLEYLWGNTYLEKGERRFKDFWAHNAEEEKKALEDFIDWVYDRWKRDPNMHIYHYASYEPAAIKRLMGRYGTRENEVDNLLRNKVFVDLYRVVQQGMRVGEPSYSIKNIEHIYRGKREGDVKDAGTSVVFYQAWLGTKDGEDFDKAKWLKEIRDYNKDDCDSTLELAEWLRVVQGNWKIPYQNPGPNEQEEGQTDAVDRNALAGSLRKARGRYPEAEILEYILGFHDREEKPMWWRYFDRLAQSEDDLYYDLDCLAYLERTSAPPVKEKQSLIWEYSFNLNQEFKPAKSGSYRLHNDSEVPITLVDIDWKKGIVLLKVHSKHSVPYSATIIPLEQIRKDGLVDSIQLFCQSWTENPTERSATTSFLRRERPRINGHKGGPLIDPTKEILSQAITIVKNLDHATLCIQGPPGAGKTHVGKNVIAALVEQGYKVGIASNSHHAVNLLLKGAVTTIVEAGRSVNAVKIQSDPPTDDIFKVPSIRPMKSGKNIDLNGVQLAGGTAWAFAHEKCEEEFDYLFIDEAGQVSIANFVAMARCATNIVLMGDQMQLSQPIQGTHPGESGLSVLDYLLQGKATIPEDLGIFLPRTYRMHPDICQFISDMAYDSRLKSAPNTRNCKIIASKENIMRQETGIVYIPVQHEGNTVASDEEVARVKEIVADLIGRPFVDKTGKIKGKIGLDDILVVAPYNYQVQKLKEELGESAKVGTVDKFQGQEQAIVILSMCSSSADSGRGIDFLLSKNRLNVALSRATTLAIVVGSPEIGNAYTTKVENMALVNLYCSLLQATGS